MPQLVVEVGVWRAQRPVHQPVQAHSDRVVAIVLPVRDPLIEAQRLGFVPD
jgi:hypothetical protein